MRSKIWLTTTAVAAFALAGCGDNAEQTTAETTTETTAETTAETDAADIGQTEPVNAAQDTVGEAVGTATAVVANTADAYVTNAAISDMYEIESSKMALERTKSPEVKKYAQMMIDDHTATSKQLKSTLQKAGVKVTPPTALDDRRRGMIDNLKAAKAEDFDTTYLDQQTAAHEEALTLHQGYADDGDNDQLKQLAAKTTPKIQSHLDMVRKLDKTGVDDKAAKSAQKQ